ncbi:TPA: hypothetical protein ACPTVO_000328 [Escherichia coli]
MSIITLATISTTQENK